MLKKPPTKYIVALVIGFIKGKSAIAIARRFGCKERRCVELAERESFNIYHYSNKSYYKI